MCIYKICIHNKEKNNEKFQYILFLKVVQSNIEASHDTKRGITFMKKYLFILTWSSVPFSLTLEESLDLEQPGTIIPSQTVLLKPSQELPSSWNNKWTNIFKFFLFLVQQKYR